MFSVIVCVVISWTHQKMDWPSKRLTDCSSPLLLPDCWGPPGATRQQVRCRAASSMPGIRSGTSCRRSAPVRRGWFWPGARARLGSRCWRSWSQRRRWSRQSTGCGTGAPCPTWASGTSSASAPCSSTSTSCRCWRGSRACWVRRDNPSAAF